MKKINIHKIIKIISILYNIGEKIFKKYYSFSSFTWMENTLIHYSFRVVSILLFVEQSEAFERNHLEMESILMKMRPPSNSNYSVACIFRMDARQRTTLIMHETLDAHLITL